MNDTVEQCTSIEVWDGMAFRLIRYPNSTPDERKERIKSLIHDKTSFYWMAQIN